MEKLSKAILSRRSVRKFKNEKVEKEIIKKILEVGRSAPSRGNSQPWHFILVENDDVKERLCEACYKQKLIREAAFCIVVLGIIDPRKSIPKRTSELVEAGAFGMEVKEFADHVLDSWSFQELKVDAALNSAIPATLMSIAALDYNLGCCWVKLAKDDRVISVVGATNQYYHTGTLAFGYPDEDPKKKPRLALEEILSLNKFKEPFK